MAADAAKVDQANLTVGSNSIVTSESIIRGQVTIGSKCVIHPAARIIAEAGPIIIGDNNLIEEQSCIINRTPDGATDTQQQAMVIGNNNVFEVGSYSESLCIGNNNVIESKARLGRYTTLSNGCVIGARCSVTSKEVIPENTVIFGDKCQRRTQLEKPAAQSLQLDFLSRILPNYHYLVKVNADSESKK